MAAAEPVLERIVVTCKRVLDYQLKPMVRKDKSGIDLSNQKMSLNPFDEIGVEEAVRLKEAGLAKEVVAVSCGPKKCADTLRTAMAMGCDRGIHVETDEDLEPLAVAKCLSAVVAAETPSLVILGKQAIDDDMNATAQLLAGILGWPMGLSASEVKIEGSERVDVTREIDGGAETVSLRLPAVVTADLRLNEPRYPALQMIMKAKRKKLDTKTPADLEVDISPRLKVVEVNEPPQRSGGEIVEDVAALVEGLKSKGLL